jgi:hypothetical protein
VPSSKNSCALRDAAIHANRTEGVIPPDIDGVLRPVPNTGQAEEGNILERPIGEQANHE